MKGVSHELHKIQQGNNQGAKSQWPALLWNSHDSPEETKARLDAWTRGSKEVLHQWITEKRYRIGYLEQIYAPAEYLEQVTVLQKSVSDLTVKTKDLKPFRFRL